MIPWAILLLFSPLIKARIIPPLHDFWTITHISDDEHHDANTPQTRGVESDDGSSGELSGGAIAGIVITILLLISLSIFFIYRYNTSRNSSGTLTPSFKPHPQAIHPTFLPRYTAPAQCPTGLPPPPPAVYPINQGYYTRSTQPGQAGTGVRFGEVGVRRI